MILDDERPRLPRRPVGRAFGQVLRRARKAARRSQATLARQIGIDEKYVSMLERGRRAPSIAIVFALATALRVRPEELIRQARLLIVKHRRQGLESAAWSRRNPNLPQWRPLRP